MMDSLAPGAVLKQVAEALPTACREQVIIIGSLAAAYHFFGTDTGRELRTKDVDCMLAPHATAVAAARDVAEQLLAAKWTLRTDDPQWAKAGTAEQADEDLPLVRLNPPENSAWFIELMGVPAEANDGLPGKAYERLTTSIGDFALCSFGFLGLAEWKPHDTPFGVRTASPEMMALANLLHHPEIRPETMSGSSFGSNPVKRSNKDLGRVLALAQLTQSGELEAWSGRWMEALTAKYPSRARALAFAAGSGLRQLLSSEEDMDQATLTCNLGLLSSMEVTRDMLAGTGQRLLAEVIEPLEEAARALVK